MAAGMEVESHISDQAVARDFRDLQRELREIGSDPADAPAVLSQRCFTAYMLATPRYVTTIDGKIKFSKRFLERFSNYPANEKKKIHYEPLFFNGSMHIFLFFVGRTTFDRFVAATKLPLCRYRANLSGVEGRWFNPELLNIFKIFDFPFELSSKCIDTNSKLLKQLQSRFSWKTFVLS